MLLILTTAACGVDVPPGLADKLPSECDGMVKPEPVAIITEDLEVADVTGDWPVNRLNNKCSVMVKDGNDTREVLTVLLSFRGTAEIAESGMPNKCGEKQPGMVETTPGPEGACGLIRTEGGGEFIVRGVAGRYGAWVMVKGIPAVSARMEEGPRSRSSAICRPPAW